MKKAIWISYDFGLKGDFTGLFTWLDNKKAVECGYGLAFFRYEILRNSNATNLLTEISKDLKTYVKLSKTDRIYIIFKDPAPGKIKGEFISGSRKAAPWEGYGQLEKNKTKDEGE